LSIKVKGSWLLTILFEVPLLAIVNEIYFRKMVPEPDYDGARKFLDSKIEIIRQNSDEFRFADFGTRRRHSFRWHDEVIHRLRDNLDTANFFGTSNVFFAKSTG
jgi:nicotinate phosphoribosyltransferase